MLLLQDVHIDSVGLNATTRKTPPGRNMRSRPIRRRRSIRRSTQESSSSASPPASITAGRRNFLKLARSAWPVVEPHAQEPAGEKKHDRSWGGQRMSLGSLPSAANSPRRHQRGSRRDGRGWGSWVGHATTRSAYRCCGRIDPCGTSRPVFAPHFGVLLVSLL